jgi:hypothetical protein
MIIDVSEHQIEQSICQYLHALGWYVVKLKDQTAFREGAYRKALPFQRRGVADLYAIKSGRSLWIEVKTKTGRQSDAQKEFERNIVNQGGEYVLVRSILGLKEFL